VFTLYQLVAFAIVHETREVIGDERDHDPTGDLLHASARCVPAAREF
jgi:hypothetical protein